MYKAVKIAIYVLATLAGMIWLVNGATWIKQRLETINGASSVTEQLDAR